MILNLNQRITLKGHLAQRGVVGIPSLRTTKEFHHYLKMTHGYGLKSSFQYFLCTKQTREVWRPHGY